MLVGLGPVCLLGAALLVGCAARSDPGPERVARRPARLPARFDAGLIFLAVSIDRHPPIELVFDTGAASPMLDGSVAKMGVQTFRWYVALSTLMVGVFLLVHPNEGVLASWL